MIVGFGTSLARRTSVFLAGAALTIALQACSALVYQEPQPGSGPLARVRFITTSKAVTVLRVYDDPDCLKNETEWMRLADHWLGNSQPKSLGMPLWQYGQNAAKEIYVAAGKQVNGMFFGAEIDGNTVYSCGTPFFFTFANGHDYEVKYEWAPNYCRVRVSELVPQGQSWVRAERAEFDNQLNDTNRDCMAQFEKQRLY